MSCVTSSAPHEGRDAKYYGRAAEAARQNETIEFEDRIRECKGRES